MSLKSMDILTSSIVSILNISMPRSAPVAGFWYQEKFVEED